MDQTPVSNPADSKPLTSDRFIQPSAVRGHERSPALKAEHSIFLPSLLLASALVLWFAFQTVQLTSERGQLAAIKSNQNAQVEAAAKIRTALDRLTVCCGPWQLPGAARWHLSGVAANVSG